MLSDILFKLWVLRRISAGCPKSGLEGYPISGFWVGGIPVFTQISVS
jgi:hypothetical protein